MSNQVEQQDPTSFFSAALDADELARILKRVDENLNLRPYLAGSGEGRPDAALPTLATPEPGAVTDLSWKVEDIRRRRAPYYLAGGSVFADLIKRLLNPFIKVFGRKQAYYNGEVLDLLDQLAAQTAGLQAQINRNIDLYGHIQALGTLVQKQNRDNEQFRELVDAFRSNLTRTEEVVSRFAVLPEHVADLQARYQRLEMWLSSVSTEQSGQRDWLNTMATNQKGLQEWVDLVSRKQQMLALDVREGFTGRDDAPVLQAPQIVDTAAYEMKMAAMGTDVKVNLGCGERPLAGYINVDARQVPDVDVVADVRNLPFDPGSVSEIASAHLVEHFREHELRRQILPYWRSLLRPAGLVRVICPNWRAMIDRLNQGLMTLDEFKMVTFGAQDYRGDDHFAMYTPETLSELLKDCGFSDPKVVTPARLNGICPEMEITAVL